MSVEDSSQTYANIELLLLEAPCAPESEVDAELKSLLSACDNEGLAAFVETAISGQASSDADEDESSENITEILQHRISWFLRGDDVPSELDDCSVEHIEKLIKEGCNQGELCVVSDDDDTEYRGWWSIKND